LFAMHATVVAEPATTPGPGTRPGDSRRGRLLAGLNPAQAEAVTSEAQPLCILAGAGSGKTRVLTRRIAWRLEAGTALPQHVLALTFTRRAAGQLGSRLAALGVRDSVAAGTFHSVAYSQLRRWWADNNHRPPTLLERKARILAGLLPRRPAAVESGSGGRRGNVQPADLAAEIEWAKARMVTPNRYEEAAAAAGRKAPMPPAVIANLYQRYEQDKRSKGFIDFEDLLVLCTVALETDREFAAAQRWRFRHLFVDEFQDVNPAQFRLLAAWQGERSDLCVVGDPNQAIYSWNGADPGYLTNFARHFPGSHTLRLDDNYRSSPQVLAVANAVLESGGPGVAGRLNPHQPDGPVPSVTSHPTDLEEARGVTRAIRRRHGSSLSWGHIAVLTRTHAQLVLFEEALRSAGVPYRLRGGAAFLELAEIKEAMAELRRSSDRPLCEALTDLREAAGAAAAPETPLDHEAGPGPSSEAGGDETGAGGDETGAGGDGPASERRRNLEGLVRLACEHLATEPQASVGAFLGWLRATLGRDATHDTGSDAVELATFHAAKGLEWPVVFVAGLEQGLMPIGHADTPEAKAEEKRLLYVAVTRAQRELHCSWAERRTFGARTMSRSASPYLAAVEAAVKAVTEEGPAADWRRYLDDSRSRLKSTDGGRTRARPSGRPRPGDHADPAVLDALKVWRATTARASGVPAFVVFHDTTLAAVAEVKPRDRAALLAIPGWGPVKADRYGKAVLAVVASHSP